jgi:uncharacterized protein YcbX
VRLASIHVYPLKGARGIALDRSEVLRGGLRHDRRFMLVGADGAMITQREHPRLALVTTAIEHGALVLGAPSSSTVTVPREPTGPRRTARVWDDDVEAIVVEGLASELLATHLGIACSLVFMPPDGVRAVDPRYAAAGDRVGFADGFPVLLAASASLAELNARLQAPVPMDRFRPNLVVEGGEPFEEERHAHVRIGPLGFRMPKRCSRCSVTTVDQATAATGKEPLRTLATYRTVENKVYFAQNLIPDDEGVLELGDAVTYL